MRRSALHLADEATRDKFRRFVRRDKNNNSTVDSSEFPALNPAVQHGYRRDIDGLRGIAILTVVGFHFLPSVVRGGFIGVDIFFVISGFLITDIIHRECLEGRFGFARFYERRIRRIFPALVATLAVALILGYFLLLPHEYVTLNKFIIAAATFTTNILLLADGSSGYFNEGAVGRQLIHLWSLSIEEQFYILWPPLVYLLCRRFRLGWLSVVLVIFLLCDFTRVFDARFDRYYFPVTRFWELLAGGVLAVARRDPALFNLSRLSDRIAAHSRLRDLAGNLVLLLLLASAVVIRPTSGWPGWLALAPVTGAAWLIAGTREGSLANRVLSSRFLVFFGLISYPLYLYHWLFIGFYTPLFGDAIPAGYRLGALAGSVALSFATWRWVETPIRRRQWSWFDYRWLPALLVLLCACSAFVLMRQGFPERHGDALRFNDIPAELNYRMQDEGCVATYGALFKPQPMASRDFCRMQGNDAKGRVAIVGDSHASKLYQGLQALGAGNIVHLGRGSCPPITGLTPRAAWYQCQPTLDSLIDHVLQADFALVILTGVYERYFDGTYETGLAAAEMDAVVGRHFARLGLSGRPVLVVLDNPTLPFDPSICLRRRVDWNRNLDCSFERSLHEARTARYRELFRRYAQPYPNITLLDASEFLCDPLRCHAVNEEGLLYTGDNNHLSMRGAMMIGHAIAQRYPQQLPPPAR